MCMKEGFVLHGPKKQKEGGNRTKTSKKLSPKKEDAQIGMLEPSTRVEQSIPPSEDCPIKGANRMDQSSLSTVYGNLPSLAEMLTESKGGVNLIEGIRGKYIENTFFKKIQERTNLCT